MKFRSIKDEDVDQVIALWTACGLTRAWNDPYHDIQFARVSATSTVLVGLYENQVVASAIAGHDGHRGGLYYLAVHPAFQRQGYGRMAHEAAVEWLQQRGVWKINLMVRAENAGVRGFYESLGYELNPVLSFGNRIDG